MRLDLRIRESGGKFLGTCRKLLSAIAFVAPLVLAHHAAAVVLIDGTDNVGSVTDGDGYTLNGSFESQGDPPNFWVVAPETTSFNANVIGNTTNPGTDPESNGATGTIGGSTGGTPADGQGGAINTNQADGENPGNYTISLGDTYDLSFTYAGAFGWDSDDDIDWKLYYTADNTVGAAQTVLFSGNVSPTPRTGSSPNFMLQWQTETISTAAVADAGAVGKHLWLSFLPNLVDDSDGDFARIDEVNLSATLFVATPEPSTAMLVALGLIFGIGGARLRRR